MASTSWFEKITVHSQAFQGWLAGNSSFSILVIGKTGVGKSSLINGVVDKEVSEEGDTLDPCTRKVKRFLLKFGEVDITIWDAPGLQHGYGKDEEYIKDMLDCNYDLIWYCQKMTDTRLRHEDQHSMKKLTFGLGKDIWKHVIFVMTFANDVCLPPGRVYQKLTPDEKHKCNRDFFKQKLMQWHAKLFEAVVEAGVSTKIVSSIPIVPAGYTEKQSLLDRDDWLSPLWYASILRMKKGRRSAPLKELLHQIKLPKQITPEDFYPPHEQPVIIDSSYLEQHLMHTAEGGSIIGENLAKIAKSSNTRKEGAKSLDLVDMKRLIEPQGKQSTDDGTSTQSPAKRVTANIKTEEAKIAKSSDTAEKQVRKEMNQNLGPCRQLSQSVKEWFLLLSLSLVVVVVAVIIGSKSIINGTSDLPFPVRHKHIPADSCSQNKGYHYITESDKTELKQIIKEHGSWMEWCTDLRISAGTCNRLRYSSEEYSVKVLEVTEAYLSEILDPCWEDIIWILCKVRKKIKQAKELAKKHSIDFDSLCSYF